MEAHLEAPATPDRVRRAMRRHGLRDYDIAKAGGTWYVHGGDSHTWYSSSLNTYTLAGVSVAYWIQTIQAMKRAAQPA